MLAFELNFDFFELGFAQHVAVATNDILTTVDAMRAEGIEFLADGNGEFANAIGLAADVTIPDALENAVAETEARLAEIMEEAGVPADAKATADGALKGLIDGIAQG